MGKCCPYDVQQFEEYLKDYKNKYNEYNDRKKKCVNYQNDIMEKEKLISIYREKVTVLNIEFGRLRDQLNISSNNQNNSMKTINIDEKKYLIDNLEEITNKINKFYYLLQNQRTFLKNLENDFNTIQQQFNDIEKKINKKERANTNFIINKITTLKQQLKENEKIIINLEKNKREYDKKKTEIENLLMPNLKEEEIKKIKLNEHEKIQTIISEKSTSNKDLSNSFFLNSSSVYKFNDFSNIEDELNTMKLFRQNENKENNYTRPKLLKKNWYETCSINDDYDLHEITYELKAVGLKDTENFNTSFFSFEPDKNIDILLFQIDGKKQIDYQYQKHSLLFNINLRNKESNKIYLEYRESPNKNQMSTDEKIFRNIYRIKEYGLSDILFGEKAKYILKNESNFEIINFENEFLYKKDYNEYQWAGEVPEGGKKTLIRMSKKEGIISYYDKQDFKTLDNSNIKNTTIKIPFCYNDGNNEKLKDDIYDCTPNAVINLDKSNKMYKIIFQNINCNHAEFHIMGELKNKCKTDWVINLTAQEIDSLVPDDFKLYKDTFNIIAKNIINEYDNEHKDDKIKIPTVAKIGKWVNKNIKYDTLYSGRNDITAIQTYKIKRGVCDHITKLFNALMYSLGYPVLYAFGFAMTNKNTFGYGDRHAWSIINIDKKGLRWYPFDATFGIFSGKLPVTHVFKKIGYSGVKLECPDNVDFEEPYVEGSIM